MATDTASDTRALEALDFPLPCDAYQCDRSATLVVRCQVKPCCVPMVRFWCTECFLDPDMDDPEMGWTCPRCGGTTTPPYGMTYRGYYGLSSVPLRLGH